MSRVVTTRLDTACAERTAFCVEMVMRSGFSCRRPSVCVLWLDRLCAAAVEAAWRDWVIRVFRM